MKNEEIYEKLKRSSFNIGRTVPSRSIDCVDDKLNIKDYTDSNELFFTDNWLPEELKDIPGKYVWIGFPFGRGKTVKKYMPEMMNIANKIKGGIVFDFTRETSMLFVFIPEED